MSNDRALTTNGDSMSLRPVVTETDLLKPTRPGPQTIRQAHPEKTGCEENKLFVVDTAPEWFIATSVDHAFELLQAYKVEQGLVLEYEDVTIDDVKEVSADDDFTLHDWDGSGNYLVSTAKEWARSRACGFFASAEY